MQQMMISNRNNEENYLSDQEIDEIIEKLKSSCNGYYDVRNILQQKLSSNPILCDKMIMCLQDAVVKKDFRLADGIAQALAFSADPAKVIKPIIDFLTDPDHDYDLGFNQGELLASFGTLAIPFISMELHRYRRANDFVGVLGLSLIFQETGEGKDEILVYLKTLDNDARKRIIFDSLLPEEFI